MKKVLKSVYVEAGDPSVLIIEYYYSIFGITIPIPMPFTWYIDDNFSSETLNEMIKIVLT